MDIANLIQKQREFFATGKTFPIKFRLEKLKRLKKLIETHQDELAHAISLDLKRTREESLMLEHYVVLQELKIFLKNLKKWAKPERVGAPFMAFLPGNSKIYYEPLGVTLIIAPWNYPLQLLLSPLLGAIAAGDTAILKPSEISVNTQNCLAKLIPQYFSEDYIAVITAGPEEMQTILAQKYDYIFYTGGTNVGRLVMAAAAKNLTPLTLELGGKSPGIVDSTTDIAFAARRIIWGKMNNAGQTCIAPDYLFVHKDVKDRLIPEMKKVLIKFYGNDPKQSKSFDRIINKKHFDRLQPFLKTENIIVGGQSDATDLYIAPTLIDDVKVEDIIMEEEIFGPILPILTYSKFNDVITYVNSRPKPLAAYLFTNDSTNQELFLKKMSFGNGCINDCIMQIANPYLPFGGVGNSGMSDYHGKYSFERFSHRKSIYTRTYPLDFPIVYPPFTPRKLRWVKRLLGV